MQNSSRQPRRSYTSFEPEAHREHLVPLIEALLGISELDDGTYHKIIRRFPKKGGGAYSKSEIIRAYRRFAGDMGWTGEQELIARIRMKPIRTLSGVAPVTVLTQPYPCPGKCIFCPNDVRMPKSYLSREPGAQRAAQHRFDPYGQTLGRLLTYHHNGHRVDKVELIILGGTWSFYPEDYQIWFIKRCFDAMNDFSPAKADELPPWVRGDVDFDGIDGDVDGTSMDRTYNQMVSSYLGAVIGRGMVEETASATWEELEEAHLVNEAAAARCVGLVIETRPDHIDEAEVERVRRLGCTKVQIGFQSLDDEVLELNKRGHDVAATRRAVKLLRQAGFKLHAHWMPNLYGSTPQRDKVDFDRLFDDADFRPDELKIYPCSLIETAELMQQFEAGIWRPYDEEELLDVVAHGLLATPEYCRLTRVIRDIPGDDIVDGNKVTNFREVVERHLEGRGESSRDIRAREIRDGAVDPDKLELRPIFYGSSIGEEVFLQFVTEQDKIVGFCRLSLPSAPVFLGELGRSAMIREVHVYGGVVSFGRAAGEDGRGKSQHLGLGRRLVDEAARLAAERGYENLAVISAIGTRRYYRGLGFEDGRLYQHRALGPAG